MVLYESFDVDLAERERILEFIKAEDKRLDFIIGLSCRVWVWRALERLRIEGDIDFEPLGDSGTGISVCSAVSMRSILGRWATRRCAA